MDLQLRVPAGAAPAEEPGPGSNGLIATGLHLTHLSNFEAQRGLGLESGPYVRHRPSVQLPFWHIQCGFYYAHTAQTCVFSAGGIAARVLVISALAALIIGIDGVAGIMIFEVRSAR